MIIQCIEKVDTGARKDVQNNVILTGGMSQMTFLEERMDMELKELLRSVSNYNKIKINETKFQTSHSNWVGGSIVASMG